MRHSARSPGVTAQLTPKKSPNNPVISNGCGAARQERPKHLLSNLGEFPLCVS